VTQRPMAMYHSWDSQNAWLRQIHAHNYLYVNPPPRRPRASPTALDVGRVAWGKVRCMCATAKRWSRAPCGPGTPSARPRRLEPGARRQRVAKGFLLNHLIREELPSTAGGGASPTPTPSPARPAGTTCACASARPAPTNRGDLPAVRAVPACRAGSARRKANLVRGQGSESPADHDPTRLVIDLNVCVGCHACVTSCKQWNTSGAAGPLADREGLRRGPHGHLLQPRADLRGRRVPRTRRRCTSPRAACTARTRPACRCAPPAPATSAEDGIVLVDYDKCIGCKYCSWACPYGARELDESAR
jgi:Fe-S-cluster-containing hydrogenase component 2